MAEQTPENNYEQGYRPALTDWRGLIVLAPMVEQKSLGGHAAALQQALDASAPHLFDVRISQPDTSDTLLIAFYMGDMPAEFIVGESIANVCQAVHESQLGDMELVAMQMARQFDIEVYGEDYFGSDECYVGQAAYDVYQRSRHDSLDRLD